MPRQLPSIILALVSGLVLVLSLLLLVGATQPAYADPGVIYVAPAAACGTAYTPCYAGVQEAVDAADPGDEIRVAMGAYTGVSARAGVTQVVYISKSIIIRGGYVTTTWGAANPISFPTTLDAQGRGRVLYVTGDISPTIEGLRITGGDGDYGGGVYVTGATALICDNWVFGNTASAAGGGLSLNSSAATLSRNIVTGNSADWCGGLDLFFSDATLDGNMFTDNYAAWSGGGLCLEYSDGATLDGNLFASNRAGFEGGGLYFEGSEVALNGNTVISNTADQGGGMSLFGNSDATLTNTIVADNRGNVKGSGLYIEDSAPRLLHMTIVRNTGGDGSGIHAAGGTVAMTNTILVGHSVGVSVTIGSTVTMEGTLLGAGIWANTMDWTGAGTFSTGTLNIRRDPGFADPDNADYHIIAISGAVDRGVNAGVATDVDGQSRPYGSDHDIGADEFYPSPALTVAKYPSADPAPTGAQLTYTLYVTNTGNVTLTATITDILPHHVTTTQSLVWASQLITVPFGTWTRTVVVTPNRDYRGPLTNVVRVTSAEGATGACTVTSAIASTSPGTPTLLAPPDGTVTTTQAITFVWQAGTGPTPAGYNVQLDGTVFTATETTSSTILSLSVHTWTVRAYNSAGHSNWAPAWTVEIAETLPPEVDSHCIYLPLVVRNHRTSMYPPEFSAPPGRPRRSFTKEVNSIKSMDARPGRSSLAPLYPSSR
jgi:uncharacterized repeat protein (TIGR01451 family)